MGQLLSPWRPLLLVLHLCLPLAVLTWTQTPTASTSPSTCPCDLKLYCNCSHGGYRHVPMVTSDALILDLSFNDIATVTNDALIGHDRLRTLNLHANTLATIEPRAFDTLWSLEELNLSDNNLTKLDPGWFGKLGALWRLNLLNNPYSSLPSQPLFQGLLRLRSLAFGGVALQELRRGDLAGVAQLEELIVNANNLRRYEPGTLAYVWPLGRVSLSLHRPFLSDPALVSAVLADVSYPETPMVLRDLILLRNNSMRPFQETKHRRVRSLSIQNTTISDAAVVEYLAATDGEVISSMSIENFTLSGEGRWEKASKTDHKSIDEIFIRDGVVLDVFQFSSFIPLAFLLWYPRRISVINANVYIMPCATSYLLGNLQYFDLSQNLITDSALDETLCYGRGTLRHLRVLNISENSLQSLSTLSRLVHKLPKLTHLDVSSNGYSSMPQLCSWPATLRYLNISHTRLTTVTTCLPVTLEVLDLSSNNLRAFSLTLPSLRELHLSGNKFLSLPHGRLFNNLQTLTIQFNTLNMFSRSDLQHYERLQDLRAGQNKFVCSCDFVAFIQSELNRDGAVLLTDAPESYVCDSPLYLQGVPVREVRLSVVECQRVLFVSVSCGVALLMGVVLVVLMWRLHVLWYVKMMWAWLKAKRNCHRRQQKRDEEGADALLPFDAFVSYSERDAGWVDNYLVPELEEPREDGGRPLSLCLHKRDFIPGQLVVDNIMGAIEQSRRTIFVLSENFVRSDWCRYELDYSHFRLFDGNVNMEAAILVLLEPLSKDDVPRRFCRLRKLMNSTTYLEWPQDEERRAEFWGSLRRALNEREDEDDN